MRIVVLTKPVPDPASGQERLGPDLRVDRAAAPSVINGNDEYALEAALKLVEAHGGEVTLLAMAPPTAAETLRKGLAMGATRAVLIADPALPGADAGTTARVLAAALRDVEFDLVLAGVDTSDGGTGIVPPMIAALTGLPYLSYAARIEPEPSTRTVRVHRLNPTGYDILEAPWPALISCTQLLGAPRYPSLKGILAARSREVAVRTLAEVGLDPARLVADGASSRVLEARPPAPRGATRIVRGTPEEAAEAIVDFLVERRILS